MVNKKLSTIVCTYNRSKLLKKCLDSLLHQLTDETEIIVIDNNSHDDTAQVVNEFNFQKANIRYICETEVGLSYARNRGVKESQADWILFLDDDAIAFPELVERTLYLVNRGDFDCVGGMYYGYYEGDKPKWISSDFGSKNLYSHILKECPYTIPSGGIVLYKKSMLHKLNGFSSNFGMSGEVKNLGEETELQYRASKLNYKIGFDPELKVHHLVKPEYLTIYWFLKRPFLEGKNSAKIQNEKKIFPIIIMLIISIISIIFLLLPINFYNLIFNKGYFWQNLIIETLKPTIYFLGKSNIILKNKL